MRISPTQWQDLLRKIDGPAWVAPAFYVATPVQAGASGWALNESLSTGSGVEQALERWNTTSTAD